jgi:hypothetical protein
MLVRAQSPLTIPRTWDDNAVADLEVPLADPKFSAQHNFFNKVHRRDSVIMLFYADFDGRASDTVLTQPQ